MNRPIEHAVTARTRVRSWTAGTLLVLAAIALPATPSAAELMRLTDGSTLQADIVRFDERTITLRRLDRGGEITLRWSQLDASDRTRIRERLGLEIPQIRESLTATGDRFELLDGRVIQGRVAEATATEYVVRVRERITWRSVRVRRDEIADEFRNVQVLAQDVLTLEELYALVVERVRPNDDAGHLLVAQYCRELGLYEQGLVHLDRILGQTANTLPRFDCASRGSRCA